jgi:site-specific recombinase XerC
MTLLAPLITRFLRDHMPRQRGYSPHSCETYAHGFRLLFTYAARRLRTKPSQLHIEQLDAALIMDFLGHIERERGNGATTRNLRLATIKTFMRYVEFQVPSAWSRSVKSTPFRPSVTIRSSSVIWSWMRCAQS